MKTWSVYVLQCRDGSLYTGITTDPIRRLYQHNQGRASKYTRSRRPVILLTVYDGFTHSEALKEEAAIKALSREQKLELVSTNVQELLVGTAVREEVDFSHSSKTW